MKHKKVVKFFPPKLRKPCRFSWWFRGFYPFLVVPPPQKNIFVYHPWHRIYVPFLEEVTLRAYSSGRFSSTWFYCAPSSVERLLAGLIPLIPLLGVTWAVGWLELNGSLLVGPNECRHILHTYMDLGPTSVFVKMHSPKKFNKPALVY